MRPVQSKSDNHWKTLLLGGVLGYVLAVTLSSGAVDSRFGYSNESLSGNRWLEEQEEGSIATHHGEGEEEEPDANTMDATVAVIVLLLIVLTIAFETIKEHIEESADRNLRPIISSLFGEMTVLGFLSIFTFCVTQLGYFEQLSVRIFGEGDDEELLETFEFVHYMLFFIMVSFVVTVLILVAGAKEIQDKWWLMNQACQDSEYIAKLNSLESSDGPATHRSWPKYLLETLFPIMTSPAKEYRKELRIFRGLKKEFILERSLEPPFAPNKTCNVETDFDYGRYLGTGLGSELAHVVHVGHLTWSFFAILTIAFYVVSLAVMNKLTTFAWVWTGSGWLLFLVGNYFDFYMKKLVADLAAPSPSGTTADESGALLDSELPAWTKIDLEEHMQNRSWLTKRMMGHHAVTRQDALYWMEREGPHFYMVIFQIQLVFTSAYISLLLLAFIEHMYQHTSLLETILYVIVSALPIFFMVSKYQEAASTMTIACSFGIHRRPQTVSQVIRDEKVDRLIRAMVVMHKLQVGARDGFADSSHLSVTVGASELAEIGKAFDALDSSGDGNIENDELKAVLDALGAPASPNCLATIVKTLDSNGDGHVSREEFIEFYTRHVIGAVQEHGIHDLGIALYNQFDRDSSGQITLGEFKEVMDAFNVGFSVDEIGQLVNELDEENDGTIGKHEFVELLEKHKHLFETRPLPPLED